MKRILMGIFFAMSLVGMVGCTTYVEGEEEEGIREKCMENPNLPICQETPANDDQDDNSSMDNDF